MNFARLACLLVLACFLSAAAAESPEHSPEPEKRALIIAISDYKAGTGYGDLHAFNDLELVSAALQLQGFEDIRTLVDSEATREGIIQAIDGLIRDVAAGDIAVIHYSGHGHQLTDDDGDEIDGYDEVLVPYDAPSSLDGDYEGELHLRDDTLNKLLIRLRDKLGADGSVLVNIDACYSGSATRGTGAVRGGFEPLGPPRGLEERSASGVSGGAGLFEAAAGATRSADGESARASLVVLSAARHDEEAIEVADAANEGRATGALSLAFSRSLADLPADASYRVLYSRIATQMATVAMRQTPQLEGDADQSVFGGQTIRQEPYFTVTASPVDDSVVILDGGSLVGLLQDARITILPEGATDIDAMDSLASGTVIRSEPLRSIVELDEGTSEGLAGSWAFVSQHSFGDLRVAVAIDPSLSDRVHEDLREGLSAIGFVRVVESADSAALVVERMTDGTGFEGLLLVTAADAAPVGPAIAGDREDIAEVLVERVRFFGRNLLTRRIVLDESDYDVRLELIPAAVTYDEFTGDLVACDTVPEAERSRWRGEGGEWVFEPGDHFALRLVHLGENPAYVAILDLLPDGEIDQLFPAVFHTGEDNLLRPERSFFIDDLCYVVSEPYGLEVLKLFATSERVDFRPILQDAPRKGGASPFELLFDDVYSGTRTDEIRVPAGAGSTHALTIRVVPAVGLREQVVEDS